MSNESVVLDNVSADSDASFSGVRTTLKRLDTDTVTTCTIKELSGRWIIIEPDAQLPQGALVRIEFNGCVGLGEVIQIAEQRCRIQLEHIYKPESLGRFWDNADHELRVLLGMSDQRDFHVSHEQRGASPRASARPGTPRT